MQRAADRAGAEFHGLTFREMGPEMCMYLGFTGWMAFYCNLEAFLSLEAFPSLVLVHFRRRELNVSC